MGWSRRDLPLGSGVLGGYAVMKFGVRGDLNGGETPSQTPTELQDFESTPTKTATQIQPPTTFVTLDHEPSRPTELQVTLEIEPSSGTETLSVSHSDRERVMAGTGLKLEGLGGNLYEWDGETVPCTLELAIDTHAESNEDFGGLDYTGTGRWLFAPLPQFTIRYDGDTGSDIDSLFTQQVDPIRDRERSNVTLLLKTHGFVGETSVYLGSYSDYTYQGSNESVRLVVPSHASPPDTKGEIFDALDFASRHLRVGGQYEELIVFVTTDPIREGGLQMTDWNSVREEAWVHERSTVNTPTSSWLHEYVHTRQSLSLADDMEWFRGASAEYYAARIWWEQVRDEAQTNENPVRPWEAGVTVVHHLKPGQKYESDDLTDEAEWAGVRTPYRKGGWVLLALDSLIREESEEEWLQSVFWQLNTTDETVDYDQFLDIVAEVSELSPTFTQSWGAQYIAGAVLPEPRGWWGEVSEYVAENPFDCMSS